MTLMERISQDLTSAMRAREAQRLAALRMAKAAAAVLAEGAEDIAPSWPSGACE